VLAGATLVASGIMVATGAGPASATATTFNLQNGPATTPAEAGYTLRADATAGVVTDVRSGSGNRPLYGSSLQNSPFGSFDVAAPSVGALRVAGWAIDPDTAGPITVRAYVDGVATDLTANRYRPDVGAAYPSYRNYHGYDAVIADGIAIGSHTVCLYAINIGPGLWRRAAEPGGPDQAALWRADVGDE
jgi:hypothetical protein